MNERHSSLFHNLPIYAVYLDGECVHASLRFYEEIEDRKDPADVAKGGKRFVLRPPWCILTKRFVLKKKKYVFLIFTPYREGCEPTEPQTELFSATLTEHLRALLACADTRTAKVETLSPRILLSAIANYVSNHICECVTDAPPPDGNEKPAKFAPRSFTYAICLVLALHYGEKKSEQRAPLCLSLRALAREYQIRIKMQTDSFTVFIKDLIDTLAEAGGFTAELDRDGVLFSLPVVQHHTFSLRTHLENEISDIISAMLLLFTDGGQAET